MSRRYICIHGHFYQPARENPWLEAVETQDSAAPFHDWNERITSECYAPNGASRILGPSGRIIKIVNNYSRISFNFGATLLGWLAEKQPETYRAIIEADLASRALFGGHGSALAQAYNHMILPLGNERDQRTQVRWGLRDFEQRFGRKAEGMWLPETAVDTQTLEILAAEGVSFTILAPHQASAIRHLHGGAWEDVSGARIDPTRAYLAKLPSGRTISLFFYDGPISRAVAFENLLRRGDEFLGRLKSGFSPARTSPQLVHIATDGETYGHHHRYGDMALAWALEQMLASEDVELVNYGLFLELHPPEYEVKIAERTAWSCAHGVGRWERDCGCSTGGHAGWNQQWRGPLRDALDWLRDEVAPQFGQRAAEYLVDPWAARDEYVDIINDRHNERVDSWIEQRAKRELTAGERTTLLELLELQRNAQLMYTSCGWFFNDISGIETIQVILYAARVIQLAKRTLGADLEEGFLQRLEAAKSNVPERENGRVIYEQFARTAVLDLDRVGMHYAVLSLFERLGDHERIHAYEVTRLAAETAEGGGARLVLGRIAVSSRVTGETERYLFAVLNLGETNVSGSIAPDDPQHYERLRESLLTSFDEGHLATVLRVIDREVGPSTFSIKALFRDEQRKALATTWQTAVEEGELAYRALYERFRSVIRLHTELFVPLPSVLKATAEAAINLELLRAFSESKLAASQIRRLLDDARRTGISLDADRLAFALRETMERLAGELRENPDDEDLLVSVDEAASLVAQLPFTVDLSKVQNAFYSMLQSRLAVFDDSNPQIRSWFSRVRAIGEKLSVGESPA